MDPTEPSQPTPFLSHARAPPDAAAAAAPLLSSLTRAPPLPSSLTHARRTLPMLLPLLSHARAPPAAAAALLLSHARAPDAAASPRLARGNHADAPTAAALKPIAGPHPPPPTISSVTAAELQSKSRTAEEASDNILRGCYRSAARITDSDSAAVDPPLRQSGLPWGTLAHWAPPVIDPATEPKPTIPPPLIDCLNGSPRWHPHCLRRFRIHESGPRRLGLAPGCRGEGQLWDGVSWDQVRRRRLARRRPGCPK